MRLISSKVQLRKSTHWTESRVENILNRIWSSVHTEQGLGLKTYWTESEAQIESGVENLLNRICSSVHSELELRTYRTAFEGQYTLNRVRSWKPAEANLKLSTQWAVSRFESRWRGSPSLNIVNLLEREDELQVLKLAVHHDRRKIRIFLVNDHSMPRIFLLCDRSEVRILRFSDRCVWKVFLQRDRCEENVYLASDRWKTPRSMIVVNGSNSYITLYSSISTSGLG